MLTLALVVLMLSEACLATLAARPIQAPKSERAGTNKTIHSTPRGQLGLDS